ALSVPPQPHAQDGALAGGLDRHLRGDCAPRADARAVAAPGGETGDIAGHRVLHLRTAGLKLAAASVRLRLQDRSIGYFVGTVSCRGGRPGSDRFDAALNPDSGLTFAAILHMSRPSAMAILPSRFFRR